ncbi:MAG: CPBP family glutamic-type intramembrane protease [Myxococcota bacterium]|nr:CPBP family glutamic-type intramembrane protease [Myxococcota bacterium]
MPTEKQRTILEVSAVLLTVILHFCCYGVTALRPWFVAAVMLGWGGYVVARMRRDPTAAAQWGLSRTNLGQSARVLSLPTLAVIAGMAAFGAWQGSLSVSLELLLLVALYPVWGVAQQFLLQSIFADNLQKLGPLQDRPWLVALSASALFGAIHWPYPALMVATALMGLVFTPLFFRHRQVWTLGVLHGVLGGLFYCWVLGQEAWLLALV